MAGMPDVVSPDSDYQPSQVKVRAKPSIGLRIANPPVGEPGAITPFSQQKPLVGGMPLVAVPAEPVGRPIVFGANPAIKGFANPFHNPFAGAGGGPGMPPVVGPMSPPPPAASGGGLPPVVGPPGGISYLGPQAAPMLKDSTQPWLHGMPGRGLPAAPSAPGEPIAVAPQATFTEGTDPGLRGMPRQTNSALPRGQPMRHSGAESDLTGKATNTDQFAMGMVTPRQGPPAITLNQLRALTALLPRQPTPTEFGQRDLLSQITAQRQAMIDAAGNDPVKLAQAYAMGKSALERFITPGSAFSALGIGGQGYGMIDPATGQPGE